MFRGNIELVTSYSPGIPLFPQHNTLYIDNKSINSERILTPYLQDKIVQ
jgi:hypothetical protein